MPKIHNATMISDFDGLELSLCLVTPNSNQPRALVQLAHGMSEHKERYLPFMEFLATHGYACLISDHRGHGASVKDPKDLGYFYNKGAKGVVEDMHQITGYFRSLYPGRKLILLGHSMGSLAARVYLRKYDREIDGLVICGSPGKNPFAGLGLALNWIMTRFKGDRYVSPFFVKLITGRLKRKGSVNANAWLNDNVENLQRYEEDPLCGFPYTLNGYRVLLQLMRRAYRGMRAKNKALRIHFVSGEKDPCAPNRRGFIHAMRRMLRDGYIQVSGKTYFGMRHEVLNHTNHQVVYDDLLEIFDRWTRQ